MTKTQSQTIAFFNERAYQDLQNAQPDLVKRIRADIEAGFTPEAIKSQMEYQYGGTRPAELRTVYQVAQHIATSGEG